MQYSLGQELKPLEIKVDKYQPYYYAGASGDYNAIHIDNEYAKKAGLPGIILQGLCTMAYAYRGVMAENDPGLIKNFKVRFSSIVKPMDKLTVKGKVSEIKDGLAYIDLSVQNQESKDVITNARAIIES